MKNKAVLFGLAALLMTSATFAQSVENDDMYFNSKDRVKLKAKQAQDEVAYQTAITGNSGKKNQTQQFDEDVNPTDTYSARNENPEFAARSNAQSATSDNQDYFVSDYKYSTQLNNWNNSYNSRYASSGIGSTYYSPSMYGYSPSMYGWNSFGYGMGLGYGMGYGMGITTIIDRA